MFRALAVVFRIVGVVLAAWLAVIAIWPGTDSNGEPITRPWLSATAGLVGLAAGFVVGLRAKRDPVAFCAGISVVSLPLAFVGYFLGAYDWYGEGGCGDCRGDAGPQLAAAGLGFYCLFVAGLVVAVLIRDAPGRRRRAR